MTDGGDQFPNRAVQQRSALPVQFPALVPIPSKARDGHFGSDAVCGISAASHSSSSRRPRYLFPKLGHVFFVKAMKSVFAPGSVLTVVWCKAGAYRVTGQDICSGNG